jgi:cytochrome d ubiquinol oxidase subunit II
MPFRSIEGAEMSLVSVWFGLVVLCWVLFFVLEGFDFGVGMLSVLLGRDDHERGAVVRTVGPFWDGNEVWLVAAIGVTFAAFPAWYSAMLSGLYLPMVVLLLLLAGRGVALEFRGKGDGERWRRRCDLALAGCSTGIVLVWGAMLAVFARGLALGANGEVTGTPGALGGLERTLRPVFSRSAGVGAGLALFAALLLGSTFLGLRTTGPIRDRARRLTVRLSAGGVGISLIGALPAAVLGDGRTVLIGVGAAVLVAGVGLAGRARREGVAFAGTMLGVAAAVVAVFTVHTDGPGLVVLASTLDPSWSLTMADAAATGSTLRLLSWAAVLVLPGVMVYQSFSYWVFRRRVTSERVA